MPYERVLVQILRNLRHAAHPGRDCPLDDHQVAVLASLFLSLRDLYDTDNCLVSRAIFEEVINELQVDSTPDAAHHTSYNSKKIHYGQSAVKVTHQDVSDCLSHFETLPAFVLQPWQSHYLDRVLARCIASSRNLSASLGNVLVIRPKIDSCLFCPQQLLRVRISKAFCVGTAPGGHSWAYNLETGAQVAVVCQGRCCACDSIYNSQVKKALLA
jgi:hypothetical protein